MQVVANLKVNGDVDVDANGSRTERETPNIQEYFLGLECR